MPHYKRKKAFFYMANQDSAPRSGGYRRWHSFWCVIATLILIGCINTTFCMRDYIKSNRPAASMNTSRLSDTKIPFTGKTVAEYIRSDYVTDDAVTAEDISTAVDEMQIPSFIAGKLNVYRSLLNGNSDTVPTVTPDEIVALLEDSEDALYDNCLLVIEDSDKAEIRSASEKPLGILNKILDIAYGSKFGRSLAHFRMSIWRYVLDTLLLALVLWRWMTVKESSGKKKTDALRGMGRTFLILMAITFVLLLIGGISGLFVKDGVVGMYAFTKAIRTPFWFITIFEIALGIFLLSLAKYLDARPEKAPAESLPVRNRTGRAKMDTVDVPQRVTSPAAAARTGEKRFCIYCGKEIAKDAGFCSYCGKNLSAPNAPAEKPAAPEETPLPENSSDAPAEAPVISDSSIQPQIPAPQTDPEEVQTPAETAEDAAPAEPDNSPDL